MDEQVNILLVDDQPAKLLTYEAMLAQTGRAPDQGADRRARRSRTC